MYIAKNYNYHTVSVISVLNTLTPIGYRSVLYTLLKTAQFKSTGAVKYVFNSNLMNSKNYRAWSVKYRTTVQCSTL